MKIVFLGSGKFAVVSLQAILDAGYQVCCVVTQPDKPRGRGLHLEPTPVKSLGLKAGLKIYQPKDINAISSVEFLKELEADLFIVISYGQILSQKVIDIAKLMVINAHASLLPKYRGAAPISWAIINGEKESGVTIMKIARKMDAGPIMLQERVLIKENDTECSLEEKLAQVAADLSVKAIKAVESSSINLVGQANSEATYAPKLKKDNGLIDWSREARGIHNLIRGLCGWPGAFTYYKGKIIKIYATEVNSESLDKAQGKSGQILGFSKNGITVACGKGNLVIKELQPEGKRRMSAGDFLSGHKLIVGDKFSKK